MSETTEQETNEARMEAAARVASVLTDTRSEAEVIVEEAEVLTTCMTALVRIPTGRREAVFDFLRDRLQGRGNLDLLVAVCRDEQPRLNALRGEIANLQRENERLSASLKRAEYELERPAK